MTIKLSNPRGEVPILADKSLPGNAAAKAINCDFRAGTIKPLPPYTSDLVTAETFTKLFFLISTDLVTIKAVLVDDSFYGVTAPVINTDRQVFLFNSDNYTKPKKATLSDIGALVGSGQLDYYSAINNVKDLGVPQPAKLEVQKVASFTDYLSSRVYYEGDIVHIQDEGVNSAYDYYLYLCIVSSSVGTVAEVWDEDKSLSNFTVIPRFTEIPVEYVAGSTHNKEWIFDESGGGLDAWSKNTGNTVVAKEDLVQHIDKNVYQAQFDYINRNRPTDPAAWTFLIDLSDFLNFVAEADDYHIRFYDSTKVYSKHDIVVVEFGTYSTNPLHFFFICNADGTQGVDPVEAMATGTHRWGLVCSWHDSDDFGAKGTTAYDSTDGWHFTIDISDEEGSVTTDVDVMLPYITTYPGGKNPWYAIYKYINKDGETKFGMYEATLQSSNIRPFNPEWGNENPWKIWKTKEELEIDRSEVYDTVAYTWTYVTAWGEESEPAPPTDVIDSRVAEYLQFRTPISSFPDAHITGFRVYRLSDGSRSAEYMLFQNDDFDSTDLDTWIDDSNDMGSTIKRDGDLVQEALETEDWDAPVDGLTGFVSLANGCTAGHAYNQVHISEPWIYYVYPDDFKVSCHSSIVGLGAFGNTVIACTVAHPEVITCPLPSQLSQRVSPHPQPCASRRSIISAHNFVAYAGHDGLVVVDQSAQARTVTSPIISIKQWNDDFSPGNVIGAYYEGMYWGIIDQTTTGFILNLDTMDSVIWLDVESAGLTKLVGANVDPYYGLLFLIGINGDGNTEVLAFNTGSSLLDYTWTSRTFRFSRYAAYPWCQVDGEQTEGNAINLSIETDGSEFASKDVDSVDPLRMPPGKYRELNFTLTGSAEVNFVKFVGSIEAL